jgi:hypothetical protein
VSDRLRHAQGVRVAGRAFNLERDDMGDALAIVL